MSQMTRRSGKSQQNFADGTTRKSTLIIVVTAINVCRVCRATLKKLFLILSNVHTTIGGSMRAIHWYSRAGKERDDLTHLSMNASLSSSSSSSPNATCSLAINSFISSKSLITCDVRESAHGDPQKYRRDLPSTRGNRTGASNFSALSRLNQNHPTYLL